MAAADQNTSHMGKDFAEFFAGIGLVQMGLQSSGWRCAYANDIEPKKYRMYADQFGDCSAYHVGDIWETDEVLNRYDGAPFLATASFPCVDLSLAGNWKGFEGERSSTYFGFLEVLRQLAERRPKVVMLENVVGFLTANKGRDFERAVTSLAELGYNIDVIVLDAKWFVPQSRPRLFVFGFHASCKVQQLGVQISQLSLNDQWGESEPGETILRPLKVREAMKRIELPTSWMAIDLPSPTQAEYTLSSVVDLDNDQAWWDQEATKKHYEMMEPPSRSRVDRLIEQNATQAGTAFRRTRRGKTRTEVRFDLAGCLRTPKGGSAKQIIVAVIDGQLKMRWMSSSEYARLQGAGGFEINVPEIQALYGFGDAVCVPVIQWIDRNILTPIYLANVKATADAELVA
ncbi:DNA cytosine methyltransferase [Algisphaera agarilytica]|uniref:DNA (cytosine-5-)-methyltransferase n=1 Tax=Algisphaera agarilytica TaxID=1385975 RepID=A0A7X0LKW8_9BACT|nr:DNA (cytosine-5-)-methyltransferase [Algisphaera agarilytica]MBB6429378.1 DNA (cytosine-5)-methyltransferase 1 [Algisphaera agarilytica]